MTERVLIVEDSSAVRAFVRAALEDAGTATVEEAESGFEALRVLPRARFDLVILDINMPDINGLEVVAFMRRTPSLEGIPIIVISTESSDKDRARAISLGANAFLQKPFGADALVDLVQTTVEAARA